MCAARRFCCGRLKKCSRNIHAGFEAKTAQNPHGYCVDAFQIKPNQLAIRAAASLFFTPSLVIRLA
ncbi:MAG: hypothetical protein RL341_998 [Pseudomonadota bacterium]|jgi:hypothetical protein